MPDGYLIVNRAFKSNTFGYLKEDTVVYISGWRNRRALLEAGYLRRPNSIDDWTRIQEVCRGSNKMFIDEEY